MTKNIFLRPSAKIAALLALGGCTAPQALAAEQKLSDLAYLSHKISAGVVEINTSGAAKIRVSFVSEAMARIQIAPSGVFTANASPAVEKPFVPLGQIQVIDKGGMFVIKAAGLSLHLDKARLRIDAFDRDDKTPLTLENPGDGTSWDTATGRLSQNRVLGDGEHIYGLGEDNANQGTLDRRGTTREMWTGQQINSGNVTANFPVPLYLSTGVGGRGYGTFVDNVWRLRFDVGKTRKNQLTWTAPGGPLDYYVINGPSFKSIINQYTRLTGRPTMLPLSSFGYWQSRCFFQNFADIQKTVDRLKSGGLPLDVLVIDSNWPRVEVDFKWSQAFLSGKKPEDWISGLHAGGAKVMLSTKGPMIRTDADVYPDALSKGLFATDGKGNTLTTGYYGGKLMDFTSPNMTPWLSTQLKPLCNQGVDSWWLDLIEPEGEPPQAVYAKGKSADIHNTFPLLNYKSYFDYERARVPDGRPVILGRAASAGTQRYSGIVWTGDIASDWPTFQAHVPEAQNSGMSGLPYWTSDSGGFLNGFLENDRFGAHAELYERWFEFAAFSPIMRAHKAGPSEPYEFGPDVEATAKKYAQLRYRLLPYIYTAARETATSGLPMLRPLILEYQNDAGSANAKTQFMFGPNLMVAPVIWANATSRRVYFPPGKWISYDEGFEIAGGATIGVSAPRNRLPLFVRAGAILPTAPDMMFSGEKPWDPITLDVWPSGTSNGSLYQDDNNSQAFTRGESTTTTFSCVEQAGKSVAFTIKPSNAKFGPKRWIAKFHLTSIPTAVKLDGKPLAKAAAKSAGWAFDAKTGTLTVNLPGAKAAHSLAIALNGSIRPRPQAPKVDAPPIGVSIAAAPKQIAQFLPAPKLPNRIEAANYDKGGEGFAFHILNPVKDAIYRNDGVPIIASTDAGGGYAIPNLKASEWLAYSLDANDGGWFSLSARVQPSSVGELLFLRERFKPLTSFDIPAPGAAKWVNVAGKSPFYLPPGEQILTARVEKPGFQLGNFTFSKLKAAEVTVEAETGAMTGVATATDHPGYKGEGFVAGIRGRDSSVKIPVNVPRDGKYLVVLRYGNGENLAEMDLKIGVNPSVKFPLPPTSDWNVFDEAGLMMELKAGRAEFTITGTDVGVANIDQLKLLPAP